MNSSFVKSRAKLFACKSEDEYSEATKRPSYVSLSCAVSGYSGLNRYDSRARQDCGSSRDGSRDRLPLCLTKSRDSSTSPTKPAGDVKNNRLSTGFILTNGSATSTRSKSVDRGFLRQNFLNGYLQYKPPSSGGSITNSLKSTTSANEERGRVRSRGNTVPHDRATQNSKSVIQQRIERLYGPAALAGGFFMVKTPVKPNKEPLKSISLNNNNVVTEVEETVGGELPVFRHLNAEFRQQLTLKKRSQSIETTYATPIIDDKEMINENDSVCDTKNGQDVVINGEPVEEGTGHHFLRVLDEEKIRLECLIAKNEIYLLDPVVEVSEEMTGKIRAAVGKCKLLLSQKFEQFAGLCRKNLMQNSNEPFPTTSEDLAGFWDMVTIQVEHVKSLFHEVQTLRNNGWKEPEPSKDETAVAKKSRCANKSIKANKGQTAAPRSAKAEEAAKAREEARRKMMEDRRRMMKAKKEKENENEWGVMADDSSSTNGDASNQAKEGDETVV